MISFYAVRMRYHHKSVCAITANARVIQCIYSNRNINERDNQLSYKLITAKLASGTEFQ